MLPLAGLVTPLLSQHSKLPVGIIKGSGALCGMCLFCPLSLILCHWEDLEQRLKGGAVTGQSHTTWGQSPHMPGAYPQHVEVSLQETSKLRNTKQVRMCRGTL